MGHSKWPMAHDFWFAMFHFFYLVVPVKPFSEAEARTILYSLYSFLYAIYIGVSRTSFKLFFWNFEIEIKILCVIKYDGLC